MNGFLETAEESWTRRFGATPPSSADKVAPFLRHRSVRKFSDQPVSEDLVESLVGAAQSAATSSNLQLWSVVSVQDPERRKQIGLLTASQEQVLTAPWFFAFFADHHRLRLAAHEAGQEAAGLSYAEFLIMAIVDASLAAERFVCAAESIGLGICYIGALRNDPAGIKELLGLPAGMFGVFGLCLGWPQEPITARIKPRLNPKCVWFREKYNQEIEWEEYDERMRQFYLSEGMKGDSSWAERSGKRVDRHHLTGREILKPWLESQGMGVE